MTAAEPARRAGDRVLESVRDRRVAVPDAAALFGVVLWVAIVWLSLLGPIAEFAALAVLVLVPIGLRLADTPRRDGSRTVVYTAAAVLQPVAALATVAALAVPGGSLAAGALAVPWLVVTALVALFGLWRFLQRGPWPLSELAVDAGLGYLAVGGVALLFDRLAITMGFSPLIVALTVVHFHYAGFVLPVVAGLAGRVEAVRFSRLLAAATAVVVVGPGIIAVGITFSPLVEVMAVSFFTTAVALLGVAVVAGVCPSMDSSAQRVLVGGAFLVMPLTMAFAVVYGLSAYTGTTYVTLDEMVRWHGKPNALAFAVPALVGWRLTIPAARARSPGIPTSRLSSDGHVGLDFLERTGAASADASGDAAAVDAVGAPDPAGDVADAGAADHPRGMVDDLGDYAWDGEPGFDPAAVDPAVRRLYEESGSGTLEIRPEFPRGVGPLARLYTRLAGRIGQLNVPVTPVVGRDALDSRVVPVDDAVDGRQNVRAWIRYYRSEDETGGESGPGEPMYVATYARHREGDRPLLSVAFPLPRSNLSGILRFESLDVPGGLRLTSLRAPDNGDDAGLYLVIRGFPIRLPLDEALTVWPAGAADGPRSAFEGDGSRSAVETDGPGDDADLRDAVLARHDVWVLGRRLFTLQYRIYVPA